MKVILLDKSDEKNTPSAMPEAAYSILGKTLSTYIKEACEDAGLPGPISITGSDGTLASTQVSIEPDDNIMVLWADMPLVTSSFLRKIIAFQQAHSADALTVVPAASPEDPACVCIFRGEALLSTLDRPTGLWDIPALLQAAGRSVLVYHAEEEPCTFLRVNTYAQLAEATSFLRRRINASHMENGVRMIDPASTFIDADVEIAPGVTLYPGCILEGRCRIESGAVIGPNTRMVDSQVGEGSTVQYSVLTNAAVGRFTAVGPFAYLRPQAVIGDYCKIGDFVEVKNATVGHHTNASHLAYIGDADVGSHVNYSCGAITVNYDGKRKHRTTIADGAFVGCNSNLVAPVTVGENAFVAAGSTITEDAPAHALAIARQRQVNKLDWKRRT